MTRIIEGPKGLGKPGFRNAQNLERYPLLIDAMSIILCDVMDGIIKELPIHMSLGYSSLIKDTATLGDFSIQAIRRHLSPYSIIYSDSDVSSSYVRLRHPQGKDGFESGEFICTTRSGYFHFRINSEGALDDIISNYDGTPEYISQLIEDFPNDNSRPLSQLRCEIEKNGLIDSATFLDGLNPCPPISIQVE